VGVAVSGRVWEGDCAAAQPTAVVFMTLHCAAASHAALARAAAAAVGSALDVEVLAVQSIWPLPVAGSRSPPWLAGTSA